MVGLPFGLVEVCPVLSALCAVGKDAFLECSCSVLLFSLMRFLGNCPSAGCASMVARIFNTEQFEA